MPRAALLNAAYALFHVPDLVRYGSKPSREPGLHRSLQDHLRTLEDVIGYAPNQVFIGNLSPDALTAVPRPWYAAQLPSARSAGPLGQIFAQSSFYEQLATADVFKLVHLDGRHGSEDSLPLFDGLRVVGHVDAGHPTDEVLRANVMLENLACKASAVQAAKLCLEPFEPSLVDYVLNTGEEAVGDRYQRGGGNLAKAVAEASGCVNATGADVKAFCCAPAHALVMAAALIEAGAYRHVLVIGGGSLAKLGMKLESHLRLDIPVLEDVLASMAFLLGPADGRSPTLNLAATGRHSVGTGASSQAIYTALVGEPLARLGLCFQDVDKYAVELHNPEITEPSGGGNVPLLNYRAIAALAVMAGQLKADAIPAFVARHGLPGFAPTQGHIPSGVPFLGHARHAMLAGTMQRAMIVAKGSLFLGKMTQLSDGMSLMLEAAN